MAIEKGLNCISFPASGDLSAKQYFLVQQASDEEIQVVSAKGGVCLGVLQNDPGAVGRAADVAYLGMTKVQASTTATGAISVGSQLIAAAGGKAIVASTGGTAFVAGRAIEALTTGNSALISMLLTYEGASSTA